MADMKEFSNLTDWRNACFDNGLKVKVDVQTKGRVAYATVIGPMGVVTIGFWNFQTGKGELHDKRIEIAKRGLRPGDFCTVDHLDDFGDLSKRLYLIDRADRTKMYVEVPVIDYREVDHRVSEECFVCKEVASGFYYTFATDKVDPQ